MISNSYAKRYHGDFFTWLGVDTKSGLDFDRAMKGYADYRGDWVGVFPGELLIDDASPDQALVVDVGGGLVSCVILCYQMFIST